MCSTGYGDCSTDRTGHQLMPINTFFLLILNVEVIELATLVLSRPSMERETTRFSVRPSQTLYIHFYGSVNSYTCPAIFSASSKAPAGGSNPS